MDTNQTDAAQGGTASRILHTAKQLFMQRGYRAVSINDIVRAAQITKPTLYYHFADKEELFVQMALLLLDTMRREMVDAAARQPNTPARLQVLAEVLLNRSDGDTRLMRHDMEAHLRPESQQRIARAFRSQMFDPVVEVMQQGIDAGELAGHSAHELSWLFLALMEGFQGHATQPVDPALVPAPGVAFDTAIFSAQAIVHMFLYGVAKGATE